MNRLFCSWWRINVPQSRAEIGHLIATGDDFRRPSHSLQSTFAGAACSSVLPKPMRPVTKKSLREILP